MGRYKGQTSSNITCIYIDKKPACTIRATFRRRQHLANCRPCLTENASNQPVPSGDGCSETGTNYDTCAFHTSSQAAFFLPTLRSEHQVLLLTAYGKAVHEQPNLTTSDRISSSALVLFQEYSRLLCSGVQDDQGGDVDRQGADDPEGTVTGNIPPTKGTSYESVQALPVAVAVTALSAAALARYRDVELAGAVASCVSRAAYAGQLPDKYLGDTVTALHELAVDIPEVLLDTALSRLLSTDSVQSPRQLG